MMGFAIKIASMSRLYYALQGIRRLQGNSFRRPPRTPFTLSLIHTFHIQIMRTLSYQDFQMIKAASLIAFFGLLRVSEYLSASSRRFNREETLLFEDVSFAPDFSYVTLYIKKSKTDPFRQGCTIKIWKNMNTLCPVHNLRLYYYSSMAEGPLFKFRNGSYLTRDTLSYLIQQCIPNANLNTHSFRIGGASAAHAAGVPDTTIQALGRWASNAYRIYIRMADSTIQQAQNSMHNTIQCDPWYPVEEQGEGCTVETNEWFIPDNTEEEG